MACQSRLTATIPHMAPPNGIPKVMRVTRPARLCGATASAARATRFGRAPPSPTPTARRTASRASKGLTAAVAREKNPKITRQVTRVHFRPNRSARRPKITAPTSSPTMLALNSGPSWSRVSPSAGAILGAATPIDTMSMPSQRMARKQSARVKRLRQPLSVARAPVMDCPPPAGILSRSRVERPVWLNPLRGMASVLAVVGQQSDHRPAFDHVHGGAVLHCDLQGRDTAVRVLAQIGRRVLLGVEQWHDFDLERVADKLVQRPARGPSSRCLTHRRRPPIP